MDTESLSVSSENKEHSPYGCSSHPQLAVCPGYQGDNTSNPASDKGNDLHDIAMDALNAAMEGMPGMLVCIGDTLPCGQEFLPEDFINVEAYVEQCIGLIEQFPQCHKIFIEQPQPMASLGLPDHQTTPDFMIVEPFGVCIVADLKTGKGQVGPMSEQLRSYGLEQYENNACTSMLCCVSQGGVLKRKQFTDLQIQLHKQHMSQMIEMAQWSNPPLIPGSACQYCARECAARNGAMIQATGTMLTVNPEELTAEQVSRFLDFSEIIESASKKLGLVKARGHALAETGEPVPGWELVNAPATKVWRNQTEAISTILPLFAAHKKRVPLEPRPAKGPKTKLVDAPVDPKELVVITEKMLSLNQVCERVGKSKAVMAKLDPLVLKLPNDKKHLRRMKPELQESVPVLQVEDII